jgi:peptidoglycan/LPS O-acetylase OafA/YrhL
MQQQPASYLPTLDGWRAVAILAVIVFHGTAPESPLYPYASFGDNGVNIFFGISGFLITSKLLEETRTSGSIHLGHFYVRRFFRILPPAFTFLLALFAMSTLGALTSVSGRELVASALFFRNYGAGLAKSSSYTGHFWSLSVEEHFYLTWPALLVVLGSRRARWAAPALALAVGVWRFLDTKYGWFESAFPGVFPWQRTDRVADGLLWGCAGALFVELNSIKERLTRLSRTPVTLLLALAIALPVGLGLPLNSIVRAALLPLLILSTVLNPGGVVGRVFESAPVRWVGRLSYSLYLWQQIFFVNRFEPPEGLQIFPVNAAATLACAVVSYYLVEKPAIALGRRLLQRASPLKSGAMPAAP